MTWLSLTILKDETNSSKDANDKYDFDIDRQFIVMTYIGCDWLNFLPTEGWRHQGTASFPESFIVKMWIHSSVVHSVIGSTVKQHTRSAAAATRASCGAVSGPRWAATADKTPRGAYSWGALVRGSGWFLCALSVKEKQYITNKIVQSQRVNLI